MALPKRGPAGPLEREKVLKIDGPVGRRVQRVQRGRIAPQGKRLTGFSGLCRFPTARLSLTHNNLCVALLLQIMFAGVTPVRCAPPSAAMSFICRWRGPLPLCTSCRGCASQPKLAPSLPIKALSFYLADRVRGPPPPACQGGRQGVTGLAFVSPVLSPSFRAELCAGMNHIVSWSQ